MKTTHGIAIFDYKGPNPGVPNVHAFGFMQTEDIERGLDEFDQPIKGFHAATAVAQAHWQRHLTFRIVGNEPYEEQIVLTWEPGTLIEHLFTWGTDLALFDHTLPKEA